MTLTGYVLEPVRIGQSNSPFTASPDVYVADQGAFDAAYPTDESVPRTEYHIFVLEDGKLPNAVYAWTKNEGAVQDGSQIPFERFGYDGRDGRFRTLPGGPREEAGVLASDANTNRLSVTAPLLTNLSAFPARIGVGIDSGTTLTIALVNLDAQLNTPNPPAGTVQLSLESGSLGWNPLDLSTYAGQTVWFQKQSFFPIDESTGNIGVIEDALLLTPIPAPGQIPLVRIGFNTYLTAVEVATEGSFGSPASGTFEWARNTGRLNLSAADVSANPGQSVFYDGAAFSVTLTIETRSQGTVAAHTNLSPLPSEDSDLFFRAGTHQFSRVEYVDSFPSTTKRDTVTVRRNDGALQFSSIDVTLYGSSALKAYIGELTLERGLKFRVFRASVDPGGSDPEVKDAAAFYTTESAIYADPIIAAPQILLPAVPVSSYPYTIKIQQGTGSYTNANFPRLDVAIPPTGYGYILDAEERQLVFAQRKESAIVQPATAYGAVQLDPLLLTDPDVALETAPNSGTFAPLTLNEDFVVESEPGLVTFTQADGTLIVERVGATLSGTTFTDPDADFVAANVQAGDSVIVFPDEVYTVVSRDSLKQLTLDVSGSGSNLTYEIRRGYEILANRYFREIPPVDPNTKVERLASLGAATNSPRLSINPSFADRTRFRFGTDTFTTVVLVPNDGSFGTPASGTVEISLDTGNLNFSTADLGQTVFEAREQILGSDYKLQPALGFISFTERFFENEEAVVTYVNVDEDDNRTIIVERGRFLVRKEETADHPSPTNTLSFNPLGREVAETPAPRAFRGGRPQVTGKQVTFNIGASTVTFVETPTVTDALPSGPTVNPGERVLIDYNVLNAVGGERDITITQPPMAGADFSIEGETTSFQLVGDRTADFQANYLLKVDNAAIYLLDAPTVAFDSELGVDITTVNLAPNQEFQDDLYNPPLSVSSGETYGALPYFTLVVETFEIIPRGGTVLRFQGDVVGDYPSNTILQFTQTGHLYYAEVEGSAFDSETGLTEVTLAAGVSRQYAPGSTTLRRSVLPVFPSPMADLHTSRVPRLELPFRVFRRIDGQVGTLLSAPADYTIDDGGRIVLAQPLQPSETIGIFYVGVTTIEALRSVRASYTFTIAPNEANGILNQIMRVDYTTLIPDSYYFRVETFTNFRGEMAQGFEDSAKANSPSGGPILENASSPQLYDEGTEGSYFTERHLANEDVVGRATLLAYNDAINALEDTLQSMDGRVVGGHDGRFLFDGNIDNPERTSFDQVTNQIDDVVKINPAPFSISFGPPFQITSIGTYREAYKPSPDSRFFPTQRSISSGIDDYSSPESGDVIGSLGYEDIKGVTILRTRRAYAMIIEAAADGATSLVVDNAEGEADGVRPPFVNGMIVKIVDQSGTLKQDNITVSSVGPTSLSISALTTDIDAGSTVMLDEVNDSSNFSVFQGGLDYLLDSERGLLLYFSHPLITNNPPPAGSAFFSTFSVPNPTPEPDRFPALDGSTLDDDGGVRLPLLSPYYDSEAGEDIGHLYLERKLIEPGGAIRSNTTTAFASTANIIAPGNTIQLVSGNYPATVQPGDILRVTSGINASSVFFRITSVPSPNQVIINGTLVNDSGVQILVGHSAVLESGTSTNVGGGGGLTTVIDPAATFITNNVLPGHTIVFNLGAGVYERRQVEDILGENTLVVSGASLGVYPYRVTNTILSFGTQVLSKSLYDDLLNALDGEYRALLTNVSPVRSQVNGILDFYSQVLTQTVTGTAGSVSLGGDTLTDLTKDFFAEDLGPGDFLYVDSGAVAGFYQVQAVTGSTTVQMTETFSAPAAGIVYSFERSNVASLESLQSVKYAQQLAVSFSILVASFVASLNTTLPVFNDGTALGREVLDFDGRVAEIDVRISSLPGAISNLESVLNSGDRFYDRRFVWIDTRINQESGVIVRQERARQQRIENELKAAKELIKLLTT